MDKIKTIIGKEWEEVFKNQLVLFTVAFLPLIFLALPFTTLAFLPSGEAISSADIMSEDELDFFGEACQEMGEEDCVVLYMLNIYTMLFMILPVIIPVTIAAYSIVGEKTTRSLEPLLATPITTVELMTGKIVAAVIPAVGATWLAFILYAIGVRLQVNDAVFKGVIAPTWLLAIFIVGPLLTIFSVSIAIMISSRVTDPRVAEQLSALVVLPIILLVVGQSTGLVLINQQLVMVLAVIMILVDIICIYLSIKLFAREHILTRWK